MDNKMQLGFTKFSCVMAIALASLLTCSMSTAGQELAANTTTITSEEPPVPSASNSDPYEKINRSMFTFNDNLDEYILKPVATFYNKLMPKPLNKGIHNAYNNIDTLTTIANDILQLHLYQALNDSWRFAINTTLGIGGLFDVAERMGLKPYQNDFGLTMARWGWKESTYLVLPFFGPNNFRDGISIPVDYFALSIYPYIQPIETQYAIYIVGVVDHRAQLLRYQNVFDEVALDKYVFIRNAYTQRRAYQIEQNMKLSFISPEETPAEPSRVDEVAAPSN